MESSAGRLRSIDILRGLACVLMAIDHVRVYSGLPPGGPTPGIFFTRWVTHFVAPAFCFFAGTGAFFHGRKLGNIGALRRFLISRGAILILLELTLIRVLWTFNLDYAHYVLAGVIWMLGVCMVLLGLMVGLSTRVLAVIGLVVIFAQDLVRIGFEHLPEAVQGSTRWLFQFLYFGQVWFPGEGAPAVAILFSIIPWIGVMAAGYAFGAVLLREDRRRWCLRIGLGATAVFLLVAGYAVLATHGSAEAPPAFVRLLGQRKYPASQLFLMMTLGPLIALIPWAERVRGWWSDALAMFGRVPMFFYLLHIPVIHLAAMVVSVVRTGAVTPWLFGNHPMMPPEQPPGYMWSLGLLYVVYAAVLPVLYIGCRWYAVRKAGAPMGWMRFI